MVTIRKGGGILVEFLILIVNLLRWTFSQLEREQEALITLYAMVHEITVAINVFLERLRWNDKSMFQSLNFELTCNRSPSPDASVNPASLLKDVGPFSGIMRRSL
jgi:hypothetical protein